MGSALWIDANPGRELEQRIHRRVSYPIAACYAALFSESQRRGRVKEDAAQTLGLNQERTIS